MNGCRVQRLAVILCAVFNVDELKVLSVFGVMFGIVLNIFCVGGGWGGEVPGCFGYMVS